MREAFVREAVADMEAGGDLRALGGAVTVALRGHWDHEPPCPLAPHHTEAHRPGDADGSGGPDARPPLTTTAVWLTMTSAVPNTSGGFLAIAELAAVTRQPGSHLLVPSEVPPPAI